MTTRVQIVRIGVAYRAYRITSSAHEVVVVIARHLSEAIDVLVRWRQTHAIMEAGLKVKTDWVTALSSSGRVHLDDALARCTEPSITHRYRAHIGWERS